MKVTHSFQELIMHLSRWDKHHYKMLLEKFEYDPNEIKTYAGWSDESYVRHGIVKTNDFELILMCWDVDQETPIHCHNGKDCWMRVVKGELEEAVFERRQNEGLQLVNHKTYVAKDVAHINDQLGVHRLRNSGGTQAMSLHLYAKPIEKCSIYDPETNGFKIKEMSYDTYKGEVLNSTLTS